MDIERLTVAARAAGYAMAASDDPSGVTLDCDLNDAVDVCGGEADVREQAFAGERTGADRMPGWAGWLTLEWVVSYLQRLGDMPAGGGSMALPKPAQHLAEMPREPKMALAFEQR